MLVGHMRWISVTSDCHHRSMREYNDQASKQKMNVNEKKRKTNKKRVRVNELQI